MTESARELLEDIQPGDYVQIIYGTDKELIEYVGTVEKWTENFLSLREKNGEITKIRLDDNLRTLKKIQIGRSNPQPPQSTTLSSTNSGFSRPATAPTQQVLRQMAVLPPASPYVVTPQSCLEKAKEKVKIAESVELKKSLNGVIDSLTAAIKTNDINSKYHNLRARLLSCQDSCHCASDFQALYYSLGILAFLAKDYEYSIEPLVRVGEFLFAAYSSTLGHMTASAQVLSLCALLSKESSDINQYISEICIMRRDISTLKKLLNDNKNNPDMCERIASCSMMLFSSSGAKLSTAITPYFSAFETATALLEAIPPQWQNMRSALSWWSEFSHFNYPIRETIAHYDEECVSVIKSFDSDKKYGFIKPDNYFYITQVFDASDKGLLLRKMLYLGLGNGLEVVFRLGKSPTSGGNTAATAIELTSKGYNEALSKIDQANKPSEKLKGFIEDYHSYYNIGKISSNGKTYSFKFDDIIDPWLKAYSGGRSPREQDVTFELSGRYAFNICWLNPDKEDRELFADSITSTDMERWESYLSKQNEVNIIVLPDSDPFSSFQYRDLPDIDDASALLSGALLTWNGKSIIDSGNATTSPPTSNTAKSTNTNHTSTPTSEGKTLAERGRKALLQGELDKAESAFAKALEVNGFNEAVVCDYISLCLRREETIDKAIALLQTYEKYFSAEKLLNLKIQVYERKRDYSTLCLLYEESFRTNSSITKKSHSLFRLIDAYVKLGKYTEALSACTRWEQFYNQNRFRADADKIKNAEPNVRRHKAVCLYFLGEIEEAKKIATDLARANPTDAIANSILDNKLAKEGTVTFSEDTDSGQNTEDFELDFSEDEVGSETDSLMSRFVRTLVQEADIAANLKTPYIKDGKYIGSSIKALEDVKKLATGGRRSAKVRSDSLFAACKLLDQIEQREDDTVKNAYYKYRLAGRAMASWGDYMVSQARQLDTSRMAYLYALRILTPTRAGTEQDWINSYNRYIKSFFLARVGTNSLDEYINQQNNIRAKDKANTDIFVGNRIQDVLVPEFTVGIVMLISTILPQKERVETFIEELYNRNNDLRISICNHLEILLNISISNDISALEFHDFLFQTIDSFKLKTGELHSIIMSLSNIVLSQPLLTSSIDALNSEFWSNYITATDVARLNRFTYILRRSQDYFASGDFENRSDCLRAVLIEVRDLLHTIQQEPTDISFDVFLPALEQISLIINDKQANLYQEFLPKLSWRETIQPFKTPDGQIQVQLTVENELNYQSADSLTVTSVYGADIDGFDCGASVKTLRGGEETEIGILIDVKDSVVSSGSFIATIGYTYKCNDSPQNIIVKNQELEFTFIIRNENFEPLINPYSPYEGKVMDDDTMFLGRSTQINQILEMICPNGDGAMNYGRAIAMYGQTRTGKSSLMFHLKKRLQEKYGNSVLIWDIGNLGEQEESTVFLENFLYNLLYIGNEAIYENKEILSIVEENGLIAPLDDILDNPSFAVTLFNEYMKKLNSILKKEKKIIILMIDEFSYIYGYIKKGKIPTSFMRFWKALLQNYCIFAIVAGQDDMPEFMREYQNEFACMELLKLNYLEERDAKLLIHEPLEIANKRGSLFKSDGSITRLYNLTAGSAYLTIILCSKLVDYLNEKGAYIVTKGIVNDFLRTRAFGPKGFLTEVNFEAQLQDRGHRELDEINKSILLSVARLSQTTGYANINDIECANLSKEEIQKYVDRLVDRNVLVKDGRAQYWIQVKLLELWLINTMGE